MIGAPWHWTILSFAASFFFSWFLFAVVWFLVALAHGERQRNIIKPISLKAGRLSLVQIPPHAVLGMGDPYYAGSKVYAITTHLKASKMPPTTKGIFSFQCVVIAL